MDDLHKQIGEIVQWQKDHAIADDARFRAIAEALEQLPKRDEIGELMIDAIQNGGSWTYKALLVLAGVVGAVVVILGGFKSLLAWVGVGYLR